MSHLLLNSSQISSFIATLEDKEEAMLYFLDWLYYHRNETIAEQHWFLPFTYFELKCYFIRLLLVYSFLLLFLRCNNRI